MGTVGLGEAAAERAGQRGDGLQGSCRWVQAPVWGSFCGLVVAQRAMACGPHTVGRGIGGRSSGSTRARLVVFFFFPSRAPHRRVWGRCRAHCFSISRRRRLPGAPARATPPARQSMTAFEAIRAYALDGHVYFAIIHQLREGEVRDDESCLPESVLLCAVGAFPASGNLVGVWALQRCDNVCDCCWN